MKINKVSEIFKANPKAKKVYVTTDDMPFLMKQPALNHQFTINRDNKTDGEIETFERDAVNAKLAKVKSDAEAKAKKEAEAKAKKEAEAKAKKEAEAKAKKEADAKAKKEADAKAKKEAEAKK